MLELLEKFEQLLSPTAINLSLKQKKRLLNHLLLLQRWNKTYNLTAVHQLDQMLVRHIMDSLVAIPFLKGQRFIDVGSGAGLPGIPLAIAQPTLHFTLLDSLGKRLRFLHHVKQHLGLANIELVQSRVESFMPRLPFDGIISRAFAPLQKMLSTTRHLLTPGGHFYALKGRSVTLEEELTAVMAPFSIKKIIPLKVPGLTEERHLIVATLTEILPTIKPCQ